MDRGMYLSVTILYLAKAIPRCKESSELFDVLQRLQKQLTEDDIPFTEENSLRGLEFAFQTAAEEYIEVSIFFQLMDLYRPTIYSI
jgi:hypothetical protein